MNFLNRARRFLLRYRNTLIPVFALAVIVIFFLTNNIETVSQHNKKQAENNKENLIIVEDTTDNQENDSSDKINSNITDEVDNSSADEIDKSFADGTNTNQGSTGELDLKDNDDSKIENSGAKDNEADSDSNGNKTPENATLTPKVEGDKSTIEASPTPVKEAEKDSYSGTTTDTGSAGSKDSITPTITAPVATKAPEATKTPTPTITKTPANTTGDEYITLSFKITCDKVLEHEDLKTTAELPEDGVFFSGTIKVKNGTDMYHILKLVCDSKGISMVNSGTEQSAYISSISKLSEKECGKYSGWKYKVNDVAPNVGSSNYYPVDGDACIWYYVANYWD